MSKQSILYLARHGQTYFNRGRIIQGWSDTPLTPEGAAGIQALGRGLRDISFDLFYASNASRAQETAHLVRAEQAAPAPELQIEPRIREWSFGSWEGKAIADFEAATFALPEVKALKINPHDRMPFKNLSAAIQAVDQEDWSESYAELSARILAGFTQIAQELSQQGGGNAFIVSHGLTISLFLNLVSGEMPAESLANGGISQVAFDPITETFSVLEINNTSYLENGVSKSG